MSSIHTVRQGECLSSIAASYGFTKWRTVYDHPNNASFRSLRPNPNVIFPGDEIFIPDRDERNEDRPTDQKHTFIKEGEKTYLRLVILDGEYLPAAGKKYKLEVQGNPDAEGATNGIGLLSEEIPANAESATLTVWFDDDTPQGYTWILRLGHLDPIEELTGVQARLNNLGFSCGAVDGIIGPLTQAAVRAFQDKYDLVVDGIPGPKTQAKLQEVHGC